MDFEDISDVKVWIIRNQLDRRNLSDFAKSELALKHKDIIAAKAEERMLSGKASDPVQISSQDSIEKGKTRDAVAKLAGVSHDTVRKVEKIIESAPKHIKDKARSGEMKVNTAYKEMQRELKETKRCSVLNSPWSTFFIIYTISFYIFKSYFNALKLKSILISRKIFEAFLVAIR